MLLSEAEALDQVLKSITPLGARVVRLSECFNRIVAEDIRATIALPGFDNSTVDGYAIRCEDGVRGARLKVSGEQPAGPDRGLKVERGCAIRVFTGAPIPGGTDSVVMQEDVDRSDETIFLKESVKKGEFIRFRGEDLCEGQTIVSRGEEITGPKLAAIASQGVSELSVYQAPKVKIIATGSELRPQGEPIRAGEIYETNRVLLADLVRGSGGDAQISEIVPDTEEAHLLAFGQAKDGEAIIVAGGVSVGEKDLVRPTLLKLGAELSIWRVALKPGKPFMFGRWNHSLIFGLPGNPVSAFVTFLIFVRPALWKLGGRAALELPRFSARLEREISNQGDRPHYLRGIYSKGVFNPVGRQESHALFGLSRANALCRVGSNQTIGANAVVDIIPF